MINEIVLIKGFAQNVRHGKYQFSEELPCKEWLLALQRPFTQGVCQSFPEDKRDWGMTVKFPLMWWSL